MGLETHATNQVSQPAETMPAVGFEILPHAADLPPLAAMTAGSAGYDLRAAVTEDLAIEPGRASLVPTGIRLAIPSGYEAQVRPRSGLALRERVGILNSPGTIDSDYRGEIRFILFNFGDAPFRCRSRPTASPSSCSPASIARASSRVPSTSPCATAALRAHRRDVIRPHPEIDLPRPEIVTTELPGVLAYHKWEHRSSGTWCTGGQLRRHLAALRAACWEALSPLAYDRALDATCDHDQRWNWRDCCPRCAAQRQPRPGAIPAHVRRRLRRVSRRSLPELHRASVPVLLFVIGDFVGRRTHLGSRPRRPPRPASRLAGAARSVCVPASASVRTQQRTAILRRLDDRTSRASCTVRASCSRIARDRVCGRSRIHSVGTTAVRQPRGRPWYRLGFAMGPGSRASRSTASHYPPRGLHHRRAERRARQTRSNAPRARLANNSQAARSTPAPP